MRLIVAGLITTLTSSAVANVVRRSGDGHRTTNDPAAPYTPDRQSNSVMLPPPTLMKWIPMIRLSAFQG